MGVSALPYIRDWWFALVYPLRRGLVLVYPVCIVLVYTGHSSCSFDFTFRSLWHHRSGLDAGSMPLCGQEVHFLCCQIIWPTAGLSGLEMLIQLAWVLSGMIVFIRMCGLWITLNWSFGLCLVNLTWAWVHNKLRCLKQTHQGAPWMFHCAYFTLSPILLPSFLLPFPPLLSWFDLLSACLCLLFSLLSQEDLLYLDELKRHLHCDDGEWNLSFFLHGSEGQHLELTDREKIEVKKMLLKVKS